jgi:hypothetical protein
LRILVSVRGIAAGILIRYPQRYPLFTWLPMDGGGH